MKNWASVSGGWLDAEQFIQQPVEGSDADGGEQGRNTLRGSTEGSRVRCTCIIWSYIIRFMLIRSPFYKLYRAAGVI